MADIPRTREELEADVHRLGRSVAYLSLKVTQHAAGLARMGCGVDLERLLEGRLNRAQLTRAVEDADDLARGLAHGLMMAADTARLGSTEELERLLAKGRGAPVGPFDAAARERLMVIRQRVESASPGPWVSTMLGVTTGGCEVAIAEAPGGAVSAWGGWVSEGDPAFLAHSRSDVPWLLDVVELLLEGGP